MLQQFRRAIAVTAANGHSQYILQRLHDVRGTEQEARDACRSHHSDNRWRPYKHGGYSWFNSHVSEGYAMFEQFRNGYYYHTRLRAIFARDILLYYSYVQPYEALAQKLFWFSSCNGVERRRPLPWAVVVVCPRPSTSP